MPTAAGSSESASERLLLSGNEAVALAAWRGGIALGTGYPGTPSTEILEHFAALGGRAQWSPNEKVALEVGLGVTMVPAAALVTMKNVGLNVAADPLFTAAYTGTTGPLVIVSADDPGMASSQNEQDNRRYALAAGVPMLEPADSQEAYDFTLAALEMGGRWHLPILLRMTTRVCHSKTVVRPTRPVVSQGPIAFRRDIPARVMIPLNARPAHRRLRQKLAAIAAWNETSLLNRVYPGDRALGIVTSGVTTMHVREAAPQASVLKLGLTHPLPLETVRRFARSVDRLMVIEEGDPYLAEQLCTAGIAVEQKAEMYRFGELNVARVRRILAGDASPEPAAPPGTPPSLCPGCPHRAVYQVLKKLDCIVPGDIGCYSLGALAPLEAMDSLVCMGASIGMGLGLRHVLPEEQARRVVSVIGDSTFVHSGITGLVEMIYNPPPTGHVVLILDNGTTAMTGLQEHPGTGRTLQHQPAGQIVYEDLARSMGLHHVFAIDPTREPERFEHVLRESLAANRLSLIVARSPCRLAVRRMKDEGALRNDEGQRQTGTERSGDMEQPSVCASFPLPVSPSPSSPLSSVSAVTNVVIAGLGGQGVVTASDVLAHVAFAAGLDVKKSEVHGMSQRGGSITSEVRFGREVLSPMVPSGEADFLLVFSDDQAELHRPRLRDSGMLIAPDAVDRPALPHPRSLNMAFLGVLSRHLPFEVAVWHEAIRARLEPKLVEINLQAFSLGRATPER